MTVSKNRHRLTQHIDHHLDWWVFAVAVVCLAVVIILTTVGWAMV